MSDLPRNVPTVASGAPSRLTGRAHGREPSGGRLLTATMIGFPLWWALGLGVLIFLIIAPLMAVVLFRQHLSGRRVVIPPGFWLWLAFLAFVVLSVAALGADPAGTVAGTATERLFAVVFRLVEYVALTVLLLYLGNRPGLTTARLTRLLSWLFVVTVAGGLLGTFAGGFEFSSPVELMLDEDIRHLGFVQSLVHPQAAQVMDLIGDPKPRPAAPWGYTNTWGNNFCLLVVWFIARYWGEADRRGRARATVCLALSAIPVVYSLNRGLWIGLTAIVCYVAIRLARRGRIGALATVIVAAWILAASLLLTPLGDVVGARLDNGKSNGVRMFLTERALAGVGESPLIGFGSTRDTQGGRNSITVGESADCERCGNFTVGGNGQLWQLLFAHGLLGTAAYLGFFCYGLWRFRHDDSTVGVAGSAAIVASLIAMFWYNALVTPLAWTFCAYALLWRNAMKPTSKPANGGPGSGEPDGPTGTRMARAARHKGAV